MENLNYFLKKMLVFFSFGTIPQQHLIIRQIDRYPDN